MLEQKIEQSNKKREQPLLMGAKTREEHVFTLQLLKNKKKPPPDVFQNHTEQLM